MTGIERLRDWAEDMSWDFGDTGKRWAKKMNDIADQIEREADVETVRADAMEAWRWVREHGGLATMQLHEETFADMMRQRDEYRDLARGYERDATWVREHGGLERVSLDFVEGMAFGDIVDDIAARLGISVAGLDSQDARDRIMPLLDRRLMPEGCEWDGSVLRIRTAENVDCRAGEGRVMDEQQMRASVIRWINHLVQSCNELDVEMVADVLGLRSAEELRSMAEHMVHELEERGE